MYVGACVSCVCVFVCVCVYVCVYAFRVCFGVISSSVVGTTTNVLLLTCTAMRKTYTRKNRSAGAFIIHIQRMMMSCIELKASYTSTFRPRTLLA